MTNDELGELAEAEFSRWIAQAKGQITRPKRDIFGWDGLIELRNPESSNGLSDLRTERTTAYVQVKGTTTENPGASISLSNMKYAADDTQPFFFAFLQYEGTQVTSAYLTHFDETWIERTLRRIRMDQQLGATTRSKKTITVTPEESDRLPHLDGAAVAQRIRSVVGDTRQYSGWKSGFSQSVGYDEGTNLLNFNTQTPKELYSSPLSMLIPAALGGKVQIDAHNLKISDNRFNIPILREEHTKATLELTVPDTDKWLVEFRCPATSLTAIWPAARYTTAHLAELDPAVPKIITWRSDLFTFEGRFEGDGLRVRFTTLGLTEQTVPFSQLPRLEASLRIWHDAEEFAVSLTPINEPHRRMDSVVTFNKESNRTRLKWNPAQVVQDAITVLSEAACADDTTVPLGALAQSESLLRGAAGIISAGSGRILATGVHPPVADTPRLAITAVARLDLENEALVIAFPSEVDQAPDPGHPGASRLTGTISPHPIIRMTPLADIEPDWHTKLQLEGLELLSSAFPTLLFDDRPKTNPTKLESIDTIK